MLWLAEIQQASSTHVLYKDRLYAYLHSACIDLQLGVHEACHDNV